MVVFSISMAVLRVFSRVADQVRETPTCSNNWNLGHMFKESRNFTFLRCSVLIDLDYELKQLVHFTVLIVHRIVLFWEPDRCFQDGER